MADLMGKTLILVGCTALGLLRGLELKRRTACLADLCRKLAALARDLTFSLRPLPDLLKDGGGEGPSAPLFAACLEDFAQTGQESWAESWARALDTTVLPLKESDRRTLREAGPILGRYDGDSQRCALDGLLVRLEEARSEARREEQRLVRVYAALGVTSGLFACILL